MDIRSKLPKESQHILRDEINYCSILNKVLPDNIQCVAWAPVHDNFSARFDCTSRTYKYFFPKGSLDIEVLSHINFNEIMELATKKKVIVPLLSRFLGLQIILIKNINLYI